MGYRSQVRSLIYGDPDLVCALVAKEALTGGIAFKGFTGDEFRRYRIKVRGYDHEATIAQELDGKGVRPSVFTDREFEVLDLKGDDWKWYPDYPDVMAWERLLGEAYEMGLNTEFVRIGEEAIDIDIRTNHQDDWYDNLIGVSSGIVDDIPDPIEIPELASAN